MIRLLVIALLCIPTFGFTQLSIGHQLVLPASALEVNKLPSLNNDELLSTELNKRTNNRAPKFAQTLHVNINPENSGSWEYIDNRAIWRVVIHSQSAHSINLGFSQFSLPAQGSLYIYDYYEPSSKDQYVSADSDVHEQLWTPIIPSDKIIIELNIPTQIQNEIKLQLDYVNHDFVNILEAISQSCNIDVSCGSENGYVGIEDYREQIRSVGLYTIAGTSVCTGFLINNTRRDCTPYFMTAHHCNLTAANAATMVTYWNFENSFCRESGSIESGNSGDGTYDVFNSGATLISAWEDSDFTLVEFDDPIPEAANAYFCGWDVTSNLPDRGVIIHHPNLEEKRISFKQSPLYTGAWGSESTAVVNGNHFVVDHWDLGTTEDGSSGAPLLNRQGLVVGQLHGGLADCETPGYDSFGRMFSSWTGDGMPSNRLKDWLDPDNTGQLQLAGKNCVFELSLSDNNISKCASTGFFTVEIVTDISFVNQVQLTFEALPSGVSAFYNQDKIAPGESAILTIANLQNLAYGEYGFNIVADDGLHKRKIRLKFNIYNQQTTQPDLLLPVHASAVDLEQFIFDWDDANQAEYYLFQIAESAAFNSTDLIQKVVNISNLTPNFDLLPNKTYYWRIKSINPCGESGWTPSRQFRIIEKTCNEVNSLEKLPILDDQTNIVLSTIRNDIAGEVISIELDNIQGDHTFVSDLKMSLISPAGTEVLLLDKKCSSFEDFAIGFSDNGLSEISCPLTKKLKYKPAESLSSIIGEPGLGDWVLKIEDTNKFDGGVFRGWTLQVCVDPATDFSLSTSFDSLSICTNESFNIPLNIGIGYSTQDKLTFESNLPEFAHIQKKDEQYTLKINPSSMATPGDYPVEITLYDNNGNNAKCVVYVKIIARPEIFNLVNPALDDSGIDLLSTFSWTRSNFAMRYILEISTKIDFSEIVIRDTIVENSHQLMNELVANQIYYWRVTAENRCGKLNSEIGNFKTEKSSNVYVQQNNLVRLYPNPADQLINISRDAVSANTVLDVTIYSICGHQVYRYNNSLVGSLLSIDIGDWPSGVYTVSIRTSHKAQNSRIVVQ